MKKVINPEYASMTSEFLEVVKGNYTPDVVFCNKRNVVEKVTVAGEEFVVKRYKRPILINRIIYCFFRKSKARRAYEYAVELLPLRQELGVPIHARTVVPFSSP